MHLGALSPEFQWLPCEVALPGGQITSYINDLHPHRHAAAYPAIERASTLAIDSWNDILVLIDPDLTRPAGPSTRRTPARIKTFGVQYLFGLPTWNEQVGEAERSGDLEAKAVLTANLQMMEEEVSRGLVGSRAQVYASRFCGSSGWEVARRLIHPEPSV